MSRAEGATGGNIDDVIDELQKLVKLTEVSNDIQTGIQSLLTGRQAHAPRTPSLGGTPLPPPLPTPKGTMPHSPGGSGGGKSGGGFDGGIRGVFGRVYGKFREGSRKGFRKLAKTAGLGRLEKSIGKSAKAFGRTPIGMGAVAVITVAQAFNEARKAVVKWTDEAMKTAQQLSKVSGSMAAVMAQRDVQQLVRDVKRGEATAGSAETLMRAESRRKEEELKINIAVDNLKNTVLAIGNDIITVALKPLARIAESVDTIAKRFKIWGDKPEASGLGGLMGIAAAEDAKIVAAGNKMMELAKSGLKGAVGPAGAAPPGALPGPLP